MNALGLLFRYELKKLLSRKLVWLIFAACMALLIYEQSGFLYKRTYDEVRGAKDIYRLYEGRVVTDSFIEEVNKAYTEYIAAHPEYFQADETTEEGEISYWPKGDDYYYSGVWQAFEEITNHETLEYRQKYIENNKKWLADGEYENGYKLTDSDRRSCERAIQFGVSTPVIHYALGWDQLFHTDSPMPGTSTFFVVGIALLSVFSRESSAKMEGVVLCTARRKKAAIGKILAALCISSVTAVLFYVINLLLMLIPYGFDGAMVPLYEIEYGYCVLPISAAVGLYMLSIILISAAVASVVALASAFFRHPVMTLLAVGAFIAIQLITKSIIDWMEVPINVREFVEMLPANLMMTRSIIQVNDIDFAPYAFGLPALITALCCWIAPRIFLRRRKA